MRKSTLVGFLLVAALVVACGGDKSPAAPSASTVTGITIGGPNFVYLGSTGQFTATVTQSNGQPGTCTGWSTDAGPIATVAAGVVTGNSSGSVHVSCEVGGQRGTKNIRVFPNYEGTWIGSYAVESCTHTGALAASNFCGSHPQDLGFALSAVFTQVESAVTGRLDLGGLIHQQSTAFLDTDGTLRMDMTYGTADIAISSSWVVNSTRAGAITAGSMTQVWRFPGVAGEGRIASRIVNTNKQLTAGLGFAAPRQFHSPADILRGVASPNTGQRNPLSSTSDYLRGAQHGAQRAPAGGDRRPRLRSVQPSHHA